MNTTDIIKEWDAETILTQKVLDTLTDESLSQKVYDNGRTLGFIAWHITRQIPDFLNHFGITMEPIPNADQNPTSAQEIANIFKEKSIQARTILTQLTDEYLQQTQNAFGRNLSNWQIIMLLLKHNIHHRGQMTVLMRQANLKIPGVYGPSKEEWPIIMKMPAPK